jgi:diaminobutyrate-2-oxoglutarate transaminase
MMQGLDVGQGARAAAVRATCARDGLLIECAGPHDEVIKVLAPLTTDDEQLNQGLDVLQSAIAAAFGQ